MSSALTDQTVLMSIDVTCLACPLQLEGRIGEVPFYFRARHDKWRVSSSPVGVTYASGDGDNFTVGQAVDLVIDSILSLTEHGGEAE